MPMQGFEKLSSPEETIVAVSTPPGRGGIGVVRLSGPAAIKILDRLFTSTGESEDRRARYGTLRSPAGEHIDRVVATTYRAPHSYTGEDVVEISAHGNPLILERIVELALEAGARRATAGEFTLRAVAAGKMDLAQAEAVRDFVDAQTRTQARTAMLQIEGALGKRIKPRKEALLGIVAELEAGIDFAEDDVPIPDGGQIAERLGPITAELSMLADSFRYGRLLAEGFRLAIAGKPNVGKSSIFNLLVQCDRAIVTEVPGTTRDVLTETVELGGVPVRFADTAGVRQVTDKVEAIGVDRTIETVAEADLTLVVLDSSRPLDDDDSDVLERVKALPHLVVINKQDLLARWDSANGRNAVRMSAKSGKGLEELRAAIRSRIDGEAEAETCVVTSARQKEAISRARERLDQAASALVADVPHEMVLLDMYVALTALGELTGEVATEDVLGRIFSTFCVGK